MSNVIEYKDIVAFHPGYYIAEIIEDMEISQKEFATRMGTTDKTLSNLVNGKANISNDLAQKLATMMGTSSGIWLNLQNEYDQKLIEIQQAREFEEQIELAQQIDYKYFVEFVGLPKVREIKGKIANLCKFFMISDLRIMLRPDFLVNFRSGVSTCTEKNLINSRAWIQTAINFSKNIATQPYNPELLKEYLPEIRSMTTEEPTVFLPRLKVIFAECGVAFVLLPHLKNSGVNGAVKWVSEERVVLAMNNRGLDADKFWFSLFHEIKHVLQHKIKTVFISSAEELVEINSKLEDEANNFAKNYLIAPDEFKAFSPSKFTTDREILQFAKKINIHPGIVAGRLQHEGILIPARCAKFKKKYGQDIMKVI